VTTLARGPFEVKLTPQASDGEDTTLGRLTVDKRYQGDLEATSR